MTRISRRAVLRGVGVTMALPWLESLNAWATPESFPKRFAVLFMGNGINGNHWWAKGSRADMKLSQSLSPLEPLKNKINVINGLFNKPAVGKGIHPAQTGTLLSGVPIRKGPLVPSAFACPDPHTLRRAAFARVRIQSRASASLDEARDVVERSRDAAEARMQSIASEGGGLTIDQLLANHLGRETAQPSVVLACEQPLTGDHETSLSMAYSSHISWRSAQSPVRAEVYPSVAFDILFENRGRFRHRSILDRVKDRAGTLSRRVSSTDKVRLDEYLTSVREVERHIERVRDVKDKADERAKTSGPTVFAMERPQNGLPEDLRDHARLMCDIIALAFQTDTTRIASLLLARDRSSLNYPFLDVRVDHHAASHDDLSDGYERIARFHVSQLAYLAGKLDAIREGEATVLDNSCLMWLSNMWSGWKHDNMKLPVVLAGGLGGTLETGRALEYLYGGDDNRKLCSLYLSIMDRMGVKLDRFGDAETRLASL